jgi:hypothetical protein
MIYASKIRMQAGKERDNQLTSIYSIYLEGSIKTADFYTKESIYDWLKDNPSIQVKVNISPYPLVIPEKRLNTKYVKSSPDYTGKDNLLNLPRE